MGLKNYQLQAIKTAALILAAITPLVVALLLTKGKIGGEFFAILIWDISPYVCFFVVTALVERFSTIPRILHINAAIAVLILVFSVWAYSLALDKTDTSELIFIFGPVWVYVVSFFALGMTCLAIRLSARANENIP